MTNKHITKHADALHTGEVVGSIPTAPTSLRLLRSYGWQANACTLVRSSEGCPSKPAGRRRAESTKYVYLLQSVEFPDETYVGLTDDLRSRFTAHNTGRSPHTAKYKPWRLVTYVAFSDEHKAVEFERYLKSASGRVNDI